MPWIPCSERLPEIDPAEGRSADVLVQAEGGYWVAYFSQFDPDEPPRWYQKGRDSYTLDHVICWREIS